MADFPPLVQEQDGELSGFDVDLWRAIAQDQGLECRFERAASFPKLLERLRAGELDAALAGITITAERERELDFSHQYLQSGLQIMVPAASGSVVGSLLENLLSPEFLPWLLGGLGFIFGTALLCWWSEQGEDNFNDAFVPGYFEAVYWTVVTMSTVGYGDYAPKRWLGRFVAIGVIFTGISIYGTLIAKGASALTVSQLQHEISSPEDLRGRPVATLSGSTSVDALRRLGARPVEVEQIDEAYAKLLGGQVQAVVYDAPTLLHYAHGDGAGRVVVVGRPFEDQYYGIAFPAGSPLREQVNRSLLKLESNGVYRRIRERYFGQQGG